MSAHSAKNPICKLLKIICLTDVFKKKSSFTLIAVGDRYEGRTLYKRYSPTRNRCVKFCISLLGISRLNISFYGIAGGNGKFNFGRSNIYQFLSKDQQELSP